MGDSTAECEASYETALYMLFAILDESLPDSEAVKDEDRVTVNKCRQALLSRWRR